MASLRSARHAHWVLGGLDEPVAQPSEATDRISMRTAAVGERRPGPEVRGEPAPRSPAIKKAAGVVLRCLTAICNKPVPVVRPMVVIAVVGRGQRRGGMT